MGVFLYIGNSYLKESSATAGLLLFQPFLVLDFPLVFIPPTSTLFTNYPLEKQN